MSTMSIFHHVIRDKIAAIYKEVVREAGPDGIDVELAMSIAAERIKIALTPDELETLAVIGAIEMLDAERGN